MQLKWDPSVSFKLVSPFLLEAGRVVTGGWTAGLAERLTPLRNKLLSLMTEVEKQQANRGLY